VTGVWFPRGESTVGPTLAYLVPLCEFLEVQRAKTHLCQDCVASHTPTHCNCWQNIQYTLLPTATADRIFNIHSYPLQLPTEHSIYIRTDCSCRENIHYTLQPTETRIFNTHSYLFQMPTEYSMHTPTCWNWRQNIQYTLLPTFCNFCQRRHCSCSPWASRKPSYTTAWVHTCKSREPGCLDHWIFLRWPTLFVGLQYATWLMLPFWCP
jgi:hypothetical protein